MARRRGPVRKMLALSARWSDLTGVAVGAGIQIVGAAVALSIIEVQSGSYLGEDDIVRIIDTYGRN
mgnify:CR=1 FL=1